MSSNVWSISASSGASFSFSRTGRHRQEAQPYKYWAVARIDRADATVRLTKKALLPIEEEHLAVESACCRVCKSVSPHFRGSPDDIQSARSRIPPRGLAK